MKVWKGTVDSVTETVEITLFNGDKVRITEKDDGSFVIMLNGVVLRER
jgi:hypothetical protein